MSVAVLQDIPLPRYQLLGVAGEGVGRLRIGQPQAGRGAEREGNHGAVDGARVPASGSKAWTCA